ISDCSRIRGISHWKVMGRLISIAAEAIVGCDDWVFRVMLVEAHRAKRKAVRVKALMTLIFSALGLMLAGGFIALQMSDGIYVISRGSFLVDAVGLACLGDFLRTPVLLFTGRTDRSVD